jgi:3-deoxy-D-manno-octulosonic-acid transferase
MYNTLLKTIYLLSYIPGLYPPKFRHWFKEQKKIFTNLKKNESKPIWIHCSSLGEYEYIKPLITEINKINPKIHLTFFSTSGYTHFSDYNNVTNMSYLPLDIKSKMNFFINQINPSFVLISQNDVWPNMMKLLYLKKIPTILIGCQLNPLKVNTWIRKKYYTKYYSLITHIFCADEFTIKYLKNNRIYNSSLIKNIRINQIINDTKQDFVDKKILNFLDKKEAIIYGSIDQYDYNIISNNIRNNQDLKHIIIPHEINNSTIQKLMRFFSFNITLYSKMNNEKTNNNILIIDVFGILKHLYKYSKISYIGGGFNKGIHNIIEPAIHGNFLLFGPKHTRFSEANYFIKHQIAKSINNQSQFEHQLNSFINKKQTKTSRLQIISNYLNKNKQNISVIIDKIKTVIDE